MTIPNDTNLQSANSIQKRSRFRVELTPESHQFLREMSLQKGKHMKEIANEILKTYFEENSPTNGHHAPRDPE